MSRRAANGLCLLTAMIWGAGFLFTAWSLETFGPFQTMLFRFVGAGLLCSVTLLCKGVRISSREWKIGSLSGLFLYTAFAFQTFGLQHTTPGMNAFLTSVYVPLVPWLVWICFGQRPKGKAVAASLLCLAGVGLLSLHGSDLGFGLGDWLTLVCAVFYAGQILVLSRGQDCDPLVLNFVQMVCAAVLSIPLSLLEPWPQQVPPLAWASVAYSIVFSTWLAFLFQTAAQKYTRPSAASLFLGTESLWANVLAVLVLHDPISNSLVAGGALVLASVFLSS